MIIGSHGMAFCSGKAGLKEQAAQVARVVGAGAIMEEKSGPQVDDLSKARVGRRVDNGAVVVVGDADHAAGLKHPAHFPQRLQRIAQVHQ